MNAICHFCKMRFADAPQDNEVPFCLTFETKIYLNFFLFFGCLARYGISMNTHAKTHTKGMEIKKASCRKAHLVPANMTKVRVRLILPNTIPNRRAEKVAKAAIRLAWKRLARLACVPVDLDSTDSLVWFHNATTLAAYVFPEKFGNRVFLNWRLFSENRKLFVEQIIPHEVAHLYQRVIAPGEKMHGECWRELMLALKLPVSVAYDWREPKSRYKSVFIYDCDCQQHELSPRQHRDQTRQHRGYCTACGADIRFRYESIRPTRRKRVVSA